MQAVDYRGDLWKLVCLRDQLLHCQVRVFCIEHRPDGAAAVRLADQREKLTVVHDALRTPHADVDQLFQRVAMAEGGGIGIQKHEENVIGSCSAAESVEMIAMRFNHG